MTAISSPPVSTPEPPLPAASTWPSEAPASAPTGARDEKEVLVLKDLRTFFFTYDGVVRAIDGVSFKIRRGETLGLVGETGCGKSVTAFSITRLIPDPPGRVIEGAVWYRGANLLWGLDQEASYRINPTTQQIRIKRRFRRIKEANERMSAVRGSGIGMIFQEPSQAMNPIFSVSDQVGEALLLHRGVEIIDSLLSARPDAAEIGPAIDAIVAAHAAKTPGELRATTHRLGEIVGSPSIATQAYYLARGAEGGSAGDLTTDIERAIRRLKLSGLERNYLAHRRRLMMLDRQRNQEYMEEMRTQSARASTRRAIHRRHRAERISHFYYGLWGVRSRVGHALKNETFWRVVAHLEGVTIANPVQVARGYPHELSGGMLQRVMIAMALCSEPDLLIADEPTTALDVTIQAQILELMRDLKDRVGTAIMLITHDLAIIAEVADRVCVMYAGQIVETGPVRDLFSRPLHPYAQGLLASIPRLDQPDKELVSIPGSVPNLIHPPEGCRFHPRCPYAMPICKEKRPPTTVEGSGHTVACFLYEGPVAAD
jgi:peptide/nickel transport system ATP-binding protein